MMRSTARSTGRLGMARPPREPGAALPAVAASLEMMTVSMYHKRRASGLRDTEAVVRMGTKEAQGIAVSLWSDGCVEREGS